MRHVTHTVIMYTYNTHTYHHTHTYHRETYDYFPLKILPDKKLPKHKTTEIQNSDFGTYSIGPKFQIEFVSRDTRKSEFLRLKTQKNSIRVFRCAGYQGGGYYDTEFVE